MRFRLSRLPKDDSQSNEKLRLLRKIYNKNFFYSSRQCKQLKLEKSSGIAIKIPIHKRLAINLLLSVGKKGPLRV